MNYRLTRRARLDTLDIWSYIAQENESAADRLIDRLTRQFQLLGENPYAGRARDELRPGYRSFAAGQYVIFYKVSGSTVMLLRVLHGRRDIESLVR